MNIWHEWRKANVSPTAAILQSYGRSMRAMFDTTYRVEKHPVGWVVIDRYDKVWFTHPDKALCEAMIPELHKRKWTDDDYA